MCSIRSLLSLLTLLSFGPLTAAAAADCPVKLGAILPVSGPMGLVGKRIADTGQLAVEVFNQAGGVKNCQVEYLLRDTQGDPKVGVDAAKNLVDIEGVSVLIYEQTCATEKQRRRKRAGVEAPVRRPLIHEEVCEGCGDCGVASNCTAIVPVETELGFHLVRCDAITPEYTASYAEASPAIRRQIEGQRREICQRGWIKELLQQQAATAV